MLPKISGINYSHYSPNKQTKTKKSLYETENTSHLRIKMANKTPSCVVLFIHNLTI